MPPKALVSFVLPAHNEAQLLGSTLAALHRAAAGSCEYETIVVDDASTDATAAVARAHGATVVPVHLRQIPRVRNAGARAAHGSVLIFVDADTEVPPATLGAALAALEAGAVGGGASLEFSGRLPLYWRVLQPMARLLLRGIGLAPGAFLFCTRAAFDAVGGFDEALFAGEELVFCRALRRLGRVVVLTEWVVTSGRKFRTHGPGEFLRLLFAWFRHGSAALHRREGLDLWYGPHRPDPDREA